MHYILKNVVIPSVVLFTYDIIFILLTKQIYENQVIEIQRVIMQPKLTGALMCYLLLFFGFYYFIMREKRSVTDAFLMGILVYGVYATTVYTAFKKWKLELVALDTLWGGALFALTTMTTYYLTGRTIVF